ncbi:MAG: hypothetical protein ACR2MW_08045 [Chthoniobacterales bacterium]
MLKNLYRTQPDKLAAWLTAANIQRVGTSGKKNKPADGGGAPAKA